MTEPWHMKKEINISHIVVTVGAIVSALFVYADLDKQVATNTQSIEFIKIQRQEDTKRVEKRLDSIDRKLDRLLENNSNND